MVGDIPQVPPGFQPRAGLLAYQEAGRVPEAIALFDQALAAGTRALGPAHPTTVSSRVNLASAYRDAGL